MTASNAPNEELAELMGLIGEDELGEWAGKYATDPKAYAKEHGEPTPFNGSIGGRNNLRAEQRQHLQAIRGVNNGNE